MPWGAALFIPMKNLEHRAGIEPANTGFADLRVSRFATGALKFCSPKLHDRNWDLFHRLPIVAVRAGFEAIAHQHRPEFQLGAG